MKKVLGIVGIALFALVLLVLLLMKLLGSSDTPSQSVITNPFDGTNAPSQTIANKTPLQTVTSCYTWYVQAITRDARYDLIAQQPEAQQCFSQSFIASWPTRIEESNSDPVLYTQDIGLSWENAISPALTGQSIRTAEVTVTMGTEDEKVTSIAQVEQESDGTWRIQSTSNPDLTGDTP